MKVSKRINNIINPVHPGSKPEICEVIMESMGSTAAERTPYEMSSWQVADSSKEKESHPNNNACPLRLAGEGAKVKIVALNCGNGLSDRLAGLGLRIGSELQIINNSMNGKILIGHENTRLFLGGGMAHKIQVADVEGGTR